MKTLGPKANKYWVLAGALFIAVFSLSSWSVESPVTRNPAGYGTIPQSSFRSGLVSSPNPIDTTGNLLMTGNVRRGMHFRGSVPYWSTTSFSATLGSSALSSFLRDTAGSEDFGNLANKYRVQPFYSPTQTVTTMMPGRSEVFNPMGMRIDDRVPQETSFVSNGLLGLDSLLREQTSLDEDVADATKPLWRRSDAAGDSDFQNPARDGWRQLQQRYSSTTLRVEEAQQALHADRSARRLSTGRSKGMRQAEFLVPGQLGIRQEGDVPAGQSQDQIRDTNRMMQDLTTDSTQDSESAFSGTEAAPAKVSGFVDPQRQQNLPARDGLTQYPGEEVSLENLKSRLEMLKPIGSAGAKDSVTAPTGLVTPDHVTQSMIPIRQNAPLLEGQDQREALEQIRKQLDALMRSVETGLQEEGSGIGSFETVPRHRESLSPIQDAMALVDTSTNTERIKGPHENLESFSQSRFNQHIYAAEDHLKAGRYYQAVDSFTLAAVYEPSNPVVLAGKGHALFAAGEYMSSALFLARVLAVQPDYTQVKIDLATILGGAEKLAERIADVEQWLARSGSAQLQFLLSYVYFRAGRLNQAKEAIDKAFEKMPHSPAVVAMRTAINQATN